MAKIVELILVESTNGKGTEDDPSRWTYQLFTKKGDVIVQTDTVKVGCHFIDPQPLRKLFLADG